MIRILRVARDTQFISANVFENNFTKHLGNVFDIRKQPLITWINAILGPPESPCSFQEAAINFRAHVKDFDYFSPAYECIQLSPLIMALRNSSGSNTRLLMIAHAPGVYIMEWALLRPLLAPGDLIIAPSRSARKCIEFVCPEIAPFIKVIPHPIEILSDGRSSLLSSPRRLVTLSRITATKLIHRQIEAMAILRDRRHETLQMDIAGSLNAGDNPSGELTQYARSLKSKIRRLRLEQSVHLAGPVIGENAKAEFFAGAYASVNLSISVEEAFPKSSVEPLGLGIPVLATQWNGYVETVGNAGRFVPVIEAADGVLDVDPNDVANAIEELLENPPSEEECRRQAEKYLPAAIAGRYLSGLEEGMRHHPAQAKSPAPSDYRGGAGESDGLLGKIAALQSFSWKELLEFHIEFAKKIRQTWEGKETPGVFRGEILQNLLVLSARTPMEYMYAGIHKTKWTEPSGEGGIAGRKPDDFAERIAFSIKTRSIHSSKESCLLSLSAGEQTELLASSLHFLANNNEDIRGKNYFEIELACLKRHYEAAYELFIHEHPASSIGEHGAPALRQLAKICRNWNKPELALSWLRAWLADFPDSPESGAIWLDLSVAAGSRAETLSEAIKAAGKSKELLGDLPIIHQIEENISAKAISMIWKNL